MSILFLQPAVKGSSYLVTDVLPDMIVMVVLQAHFVDDRADNLRNEPVFTACLDKPVLASQPTISRFFNRMDETTLKQFEDIQKKMHSIIFSLPGQRPIIMVFDLDTTLLNTYGDQQGSAWNYHYQSDGYHTNVCFILANEMICRL